jgi:uncharacterized membrane protein
MKITNAALLAAATTAVGMIAASQAFAGPATAPAYEFEKCFGIAGAHQNDCQTASNSCAGTVAQAGKGDAWIFVPKGVCGKIKDSSLEPKS